MNDDGRLDFGLLTKGLRVAAIPGICLGPGGGGRGAFTGKWEGTGLALQDLVLLPGSPPLIFPCRAPPPGQVRYPR